MRQFVVFLLLSGACVVTAQTTSPLVPRPPENSPALTIQITVNLVQVDAVVTDSKNHPVTNLQAKGFRNSSGRGSSSHHQPQLHPRARPGHRPEANVADEKRSRSTSA